MSHSFVDVFVDMPFGPIHVITSNMSSQQTPLVFIPGMLGRAEDWLNDFESFQPRPCVAISLRGRGGSAYPSSGFSVYDHAEDIARVVDSLKLKKFILVGFSQGALYAVAYALKNPQRIAGLVIQDKTLKQKKFGKEWVQRAKAHPMAQNKENFLWGIANDSQELNLLEKCHVFAKTPTLIIKGENSALLMDEDLMEMETVFKSCRIEIFPESGHDISSPDYDLYISTMKDFFKTNFELS